MVFGFYVYKRQWLTKGDIGSWKRWGVLACVSIALYALLFQIIVLPLLNEMAKVAEHHLLFSDEMAMPALDRSFLIAAASTFFLSPLSCIFILMFFLSFTKRFFNKPNAITTFCSKHSINVYVLHYIPVFILGHAFLNMPLPSMAKIILMPAIIIPACLWMSHHLVYPHPKIAIAFFAALKLIALAVGFTFYYYAILALLVISFTGAIYESAKWLTVARRTGSGMLTADA